MENLSTYILNEDLKGTIKRLLAKFRGIEKDESKLFKDMSDLAEWNGKLISPAEAQRLVDIRTQFQDGKTIFVGMDSTQSLIRKCGFIQAVLDYAHLNWKHKVDSDPFGENSSERAYQYACKDYEEDDKGISAGYFAIPLFRIYPKGWRFAQELNIMMANQWRVDFRTGKLKYIK